MGIDRAAAVALDCNEDQLEAGTRYHHGGADTRQIFSFEGNQVEVFYSHVSNEVVVT